MADSLLTKGSEMLNTKGFTLIELVTTITVIGVAFICVFYIFNNTAEIYNHVAGGSEDLQRIQQITGYLDADLKNVKDKNSILIASGSQFKFINVNQQTIDFVYINPYLKKNNVNLTRDLSGFSFTYFKFDGMQWTSARPLSEIGRILITGTVINSGQLNSFRQSVSLRNCR